jgi:hypothetical protein
MYEKQRNQLKEMNFKNDELNLVILKQFDGDIKQTLKFLLQN